VRYYVKCNNIYNNKEIQLLDENDNVLLIIHKRLHAMNKTIDIHNANNEKVYHVNFYPLKVKNRYLVTNQSQKVVINISTGLHLLHRINIGEKQLVCKSTLLKINYWLYDYDMVIGNLQVVKKNRKRYFEITLQEDNILQAIALYIVAQAQRIWFLRK